MKGNMSQSRNAGAFENFVPKSRKINGQTLDNDVQIDNVASANKLKEAKIIGLSGAVGSNSVTFDGSGNVYIPITYLKEAYLEWGGKNRANLVSPIDSAILPELSTNRLAFIPNSAVKFERSADAGATWTDVSKDYNGTALCTGTISFGNGNTSNDKSINKKHRVTIDCIDGKLYSVLTKILIQSTTSGATGCKCKVEVGKEQWTTVAESELNGWPGWNVINFESLTIGSADTNRYIRLTFSIDGVDSVYDSDFKILSLRFISKSFFGTASSTMALTGHLYSYDSEQNATFPNNLAIQGNTLKIGSTTLTETQLKALLALLT